MKSSRGPSRAGSGASGARGAAGARGGPVRGRDAEPLELARAAGAGEFPPSLYLEGPSEAVKTALLSSLRHGWAKRSPESPTARVLRTAESSVEEMLALVQGASLFSPRDLVIVLEIEDLGRGEKKIDALAAGIRGPLGESSLVLVESAADAARKSMEPLRAACAVRTVALPPDRRTMLVWGALKLSEATLTPAAGVLEAVADASEGDALAFFGEVSRLASWAEPGGPVTMDDVGQLLRPAVGAELPDYLAAVAMGDARLAAQRLGRLLAAGVGEGAILFALSNMVGGALGGWTRDRAASQTLLRRRGGPPLIPTMDALYRAEAAWKGGRADVVALLEQATRDVCGAS
jgi:DNA polymerase III delta subunit